MKPSTARAALLLLALPLQAGVALAADLDLVIANGRVVLDGGVMTGERPGKPLKPSGGQATEPPVK
jgi:hypothetical protein